MKDLSPELETVQPLDAAAVGPRQHLPATTEARLLEITAFAIDEHAMVRQTDGVGGMVGIGDRLGYDGEVHSFRPRVLIEVESGAIPLQCCQGVLTSVARDLRDAFAELPDEVSLEDMIGAELVGELRSCGLAHDDCNVLLNIIHLMALRHRAVRGPLCWPQHGLGGDARAAGQALAQPQAKALWRDVPIVRGFPRVVEEQRLGANDAQQTRHFVASEH